MAKDNPQNHKPTGLKYNIQQGGETKKPAREGGNQIKDSNMKDLLLLSLPNIIISIVMWILFIVFKPAFWIGISIISLFTIGRLIYAKEKRFYIYILQLSIMYVFLIVLYLVNFLFLGHAVIGSIVVMILIGGYIVIRNWEQYIMAIERVEYTIYKKPLHEIKKKDKEENKADEKQI